MRRDYRDPIGVDAGYQDRRVAMQTAIEGGLHITPEGVKLIALMEEIGYGEIRVKVAKGCPVMVIDVQTNIDLTKPLDG